MFVFGDDLVRIRKKSGILQENLAKKLGFSRSYICKLESGERLPTRDLILKLSLVCDLDKYTTNRLLILNDLDPEFDSSNESYKLLLKLAINLKEEGFVEPALKLIEKTIKIFDNTIEIYALKANFYLLKKDFDSAIKNYEDAIKYYPDSVISFYKIAITKAELIHNLGYVYFEKSLVNKSLFEKKILEFLNSTEESSIINQLRNESIFSLDIAIEKFETALKIEPENQHITEQLARAYLNRASLEIENINYKIDSPAKRTKFLKKAISLYEKYISFPINTSLISRRLEASIFLAMAYAKMMDLKESSKIINIIISCKPDYSIAYYAKACIFSINGKDKIEILQTAYDSLKIALELNKSLKKEIKYEIDLINLQTNPLFDSRFINLGKQINEEKN